MWLILGERIGNMFIVTKSAAARNLVEGNLNALVRAMYLSPSAHGNRILARLWSKTAFKKLW